MSDLPYTLVLPEGYVKVPLPGLNAWVTALRSGEYVQGRDETLFEAGCYCCLGVLSAIQGRLTPGNPVDGWEADGLAVDNPCHPVLGYLGNLPPGVICVYNDWQLGRLAALNDQGMTFAQIADVLVAVYVEASGEPLLDVTDAAQRVPTDEEVRL